MPNIEHIYWFAHYNLNCPSTRYRGLKPLEHASKQFGITYHFITPDRSLKGVLSFLRVFLSVLLFRKKNSLIAVQKVCSNGLYAKALKFLISVRNQNTLYDIDDAEYLRQGVDSLHFFLEKCESIQVGSKALQDYCLAFNQNVRIATSPVHDHGIVKKQKNPTIHIGWVGDFGNGQDVSKSFSHKKSLYDLYFPFIKQISFPIKLFIIGVKNQADIPEIRSYFKSHPNIELIIPQDLDWTNDDWLFDIIKKFDIGISPLVPHPFNEAKSAFKAKQYLSCGVPTIASDVGENQHFISDGRNGFLCDTSDEFLKAVNQIANANPTEYQSLMTHSIESTVQFSLSEYCSILLAN
ncbi:glycosyltransferase [Pontibacter sp. G13]|uniref:glycosyltransferase n=1 Tax=Pontibacter sp. G13 TaxID=3074898 RepID=UPI00288C502E|nr:glycosyltransferase [Pontibacter sp. G13]WNJ17639.1 glycosyltransferase [Pontibacter sp. G13]